MYYFASDVHLGLDCAGMYGDSRLRERIFVEWLDRVSADARAIYLVGDLFDFWYEYKRVVPKGFTRVLGKISEITDRGVEIHLFTGNHDIWAFRYLADECGVVLHHYEAIVELCGKRLFIAHGDNLANKPMIVRLMGATFRSKSAQWLFGWLVHPDLALKFGGWWSRGSRKSKSITHVFRGENEPLVSYGRELARRERIDYLVFGHTHCAENYDLGEGHRALFLGEWIENPVYGALNENGFEIKKV